MTREGVVNTPDMFLKNWRRENARTKSKHGRQRQVIHGCRDQWIYFPWKKL